MGQGARGFHVKHKHEVSTFSLNRPEADKVRESGARIAKVVVQQFVRLRDGELKALRKELGVNLSEYNFTDYVGIEAKTGIQAEIDRTNKERKRR